MPEQVQPNEEYAISKQELIDLMTDTDVKEAVKEALRADSINISNLPDAQSLAGKSLPIVENGALKSIPYATVIETVNTAASAANAAATAADTATASANAAATNANSAATTATSAAGTATTAAAQAIQAAETIPEEIEEAIADVLGGASSVDVQTVGNLLVEAGTACKITQKPYNSKSSNEAEFVKKNTAFDAYYVADTGNKIYGVTVTMGGVDISSTAVKEYNSSAAHVNIASVTGAVVIDVKATKAIVFEDNAVKALCVENWGGNYIEGEITEYEAAQVTNLNAVFYNNDTITKFNELRYFTGLTTLYRSGSGDSVTGQFHSCALLEEITIPKAPINDFRGAFRTSDTLEEIDLSPTTATRYRIDSLVHETSSGTYPMKKVKLPKGAVTQSPLRAFWRAKKLTTIEIDGYLDFSEATSFANFAVSANSLTTITGIFMGIRASLDMSDCPLTHDSVMVIINGLETVSRANLKLSTTTYNSLSEDEIAIATDKGWNVATP
jgi:hypothetical protein